jgi:hypothetical protein
MIRRQYIVVPVPGARFGRLIVLDPTNPIVAANLYQQLQVNSTQVVTLLVLNNMTFVTAPSGAVLQDVIATQFLLELLGEDLQLRPPNPRAL